MKCFRKIFILEILLHILNIHDNADEEEIVFKLLLYICGAAIQVYEVKSFTKIPWFCQNNLKIENVKTLIILVKQ